MKSLLFIAVFAISTLAVVAQDNDPLVIKVENEEIHLSEFMSVYSKNRDESELDKDDLLKYLDLYLNFKLKVHEAKAQGLDTNFAFKRELAGYRAQLAKPYLIDSEVTDKLLQEAYERLKSEVRASHILFKVGENASPEDTLKAYNQAMRVRGQLEAGNDFGELAVRYSGDPSAQANQGDLGYFTSMYMVYPFETAAYKLSVGDISMPVRSRFGYHLIKVTDKRVNQGEVKVAHIMIRPREAKNEESILEAKAKANEIYNLLLDGADFSELAAAHSGDKSTAKNGGELPFFGSNVMVESFEKAAFSLTEVGQLAAPVQTEYGWHIIKLLDRKGLKDFEAIKYELKQKVEKDSRSELSKTSFINRLKKEYNFVEYKSRLKTVIGMLDESFFKDEWKVPSSSKLNSSLFKFADQTRTLNDFADYLAANQVRTSAKLNFNDLVANYYNDYVSKEIMTYEDSQLENKYPKFASLMTEYYEGILLFELSDKMIWTKASTDSAGLANFYEGIKGRFMWPDRMEAFIVQTSSEKAAKTAKKLLGKGKDVNDVAAKLNKKSALNFSSEKGVYSKEDHQLIAEMNWSESFSEIKLIDGRYTFIQNKAIVPSSPKELKNVRGIVVSEYQGILENQWIELLRKKYEYKVYPEVIKAL